MNIQAFNYSNIFSFLETHFKKILLVIVLLTSVFVIKEWRKNTQKSAAKKVAKLFYSVEKKIQAKEAVLLKAFNKKNKSKNPKINNKQKKQIVKNQKALKKHFASLLTEYQELLKTQQTGSVFFSSSLYLAKFLNSYKAFKTSIQVLKQASLKVQNHSIFYPFIFHTLALNYIQLKQYKQAKATLLKITNQPDEFNFIQASSLLNLSLVYFKLQQWSLLKNNIATLENNYPQSNENTTAQTIKRYLILNKK